MKTELREKVLKLIYDWNEYSGKELADSILKAVREALPEEMENTLPGMRGEGWNDCLKEIRRRLGADEA